MDRHLEGFALTGAMRDRFVEATLSSGILFASREWLEPAQRLVDTGIRFQREGRWFRASLEGEALHVLVTLLRCPVRIRSASLSFQRDASRIGAHR